jgi:hypothetical protein
MILVIGRIAGQGRVRHLENGVTHRFGYRIVDRISNRLGRIDERPVRFLNCAVRYLDPLACNQKANFHRIPPSLGRIVENNRPMF